MARRRRRRTFEIGDKLACYRAEDSGGGIIGATVLDFTGNQDDHDVITIRLRDGTEIDLYVQSLRACVVQKVTR